jgi:very-short-patch-repair endonuclease
MVTSLKETVMIDAPSRPPFERGMQEDFGLLQIGIMLAYRNDLKKTARTLRKNMTDAERNLWSRLRNKQILGVQFYRQKPIGPYIVDFYAPAANLVIEVDGSGHMETKNQKQDHVRDVFLTNKGLHVIRIDNLQVLQQINSVVEMIFNAVLDRLEKV